MKAVVYSLGCKVNAVEGRSIMRQLSDNGWETSDELVFADAYVLNTCTVTAEADRKCRQTIGKIIKINENAKIYVIGCSSQNDATKYEKYQNVVYIGGLANKNSIISTMMSEVIVGNFDKLAKNFDIPSVFEEMPYPIHTKTREFIKIQDGCNNFCSYCKIPYVRGRERSRSIQSIVNEAERSANVCGEIVLTGINVSAYGKDINTGLTDLVYAMKDINVRKRLGSLECNIVDDGFAEAITESGFCDHFHLSLQSGSDNVLKKMNRHYTTTEYFDKVNLLRKYFKQAGITTDIIVGFPSETDADFNNTKNFVKEVGFSDIHVFPYSARSGTVAARMPQLPADVIKHRAAELTEIKHELHRKFLTEQIGKTLSVYIESSGEGYSTNYARVYTEGAENSTLNVKIKSLYKEGVK